MLSDHELQMFRNSHNHLSDEEKVKAFEDLLDSRKGKEIIKGETAQKFYASFTAIKTAGLKPEFSNNEAEKLLIERRKEFIQKYFSKVLNNIKEYMTVISAQERIRLENFDSPEKFKEAMLAADHDRRYKHEALIAALKALIRNININFNQDFPNDLRLSLEAQMPDRQGLNTADLQNILSQREYLKFPDKQNVFINLRESAIDPSLERNTIANWALKIYEDLTSLDSKINS